MTWIAVDVDDTLTNFQDTAREIFVDFALEQRNKRYQRGAYCAWGEWRSPVDVTDDDIWPMVIDRCHSPERITAQVPYAGAAKTLHELAAQGYQLRYISNRKPAVWDVTYDWLTDNGFPPGELYCLMEDKIPEIRDCQYLIDDRPKTLVQFVYEFHWQHKHGSENQEKRRIGFGIYTPYNAALTDVPGIKLAPNWKLLRQYLIDQGVLDNTKVALA